MTFIQELQQKLGNKKATVNETILNQHSNDESYHKKSLPSIVVFPENSEEVQDIIKIANKFKQDVIPFGAGSSLEGSAIPYNEAIVIDFSLMNKIISIREEDFLVRVQPGVTLSQLNYELKKYGMFFPVDPGADATLGGMAATNASGTLSVRYGVMRDRVRKITLVTADETVIDTGSLAAKSSSGYHLNGLLVGSEGTLGCFTELVLQIEGIPENIVAARISFEELEDSIEFVTTIRQSGVAVARVELADKESIGYINWFNQTDYIENPTIFLELHGNKEGLKEDLAFVKEIAASCRCDKFEFAADTAERNELWKARHNILYAYTHGNPNKKLMITDVCLPISELAKAIKKSRKLIENNDINGGIVGHVGDGNYHVFLMIDVDKEIEKANKINEQIVNYALSHDGTCTGEHGVGVGKRKYQAEEHGESIKLMQAIKQAIDYNNRMNPGKVL